MSDGMLAGLTVLVSGVGPGLGREITTAALREGAQVMMAARTGARLKQIGEEVDPSGDRLAWHVTDIAEAAQCEDLVAAVLARFGHLDAVVHCAAVDNVMGGLRQADFADLDRVLGVNLYGTLYLTRSRPRAVGCVGARIDRGHRCPVEHLGSGAPAVLLSQQGCAHVGHASPGRRGRAAADPGQLGGAGVDVRTPGGGLRPDGGRAPSGHRGRGAGRVDRLHAARADGHRRRRGRDGGVLRVPRSKGITGQTLLVNAGEIMR